jgi:phosphoenolpyruvate-protein kinase (PTS system EI component)
LPKRRRGRGAEALGETADRLREDGGEGRAGIFEAYVEMAEDPEFHSEVEERVRNLTSPEAAVLAMGEEYGGRALHPRLPPALHTGVRGR